MRNQFMPRFGAKMRYVDYDRGVIGQDLNHLSRNERAKPLAQFENREGTTQAANVKFGIEFHDRILNHAFQPVHGNLTPRDVTCMPRISYIFAKREPTCLA